MSAIEPVESILERAGALLHGHFVLSSGLHADRYCQCAALFEHPALAGELAGRMADVVRPLAPEVVLAPALGGILWGYELARALGCRTFFAERQPGQPFALRRSFVLEPGTRVLLAEDVVTTGGSVMELVPLVEGAGARVVGFASVVDRSGGKFNPAVQFHALARFSFPTYEPEACPLCASGIPARKPGSRHPA